MATLVALHIGAAAVRASLFDATGRLLDDQRAPCPPVARSDGHREQSAARLWHLASQCLRALDDRRADARALALTADSPSLVVLPAGGSTARVIVAGDARFARAGVSAPPWSGDAAHALQWLDDHGGEAMAHGATVGDILTLFAERLTGARVREGSWRTREPEPTLDPRWAAAFTAGAIVGELSERAAHETSLPALVAVVNAGPSLLTDRYGRGLLEGTGDALLRLDDGATLAVDVPRSMRATARARCATLTATHDLAVDWAPLAARLEALGAALPLGCSFDVLEARTPENQPDHEAAASELSALTAELTEWVRERASALRAAGLPLRSLTLSVGVGRLSVVGRALAAATRLEVRRGADGSRAARGAAWVAARTLEPHTEAWREPTDT